MLTPAEVKKHVKKTLEIYPIGGGPQEIRGAKEFYMYMFTQHPDLRKYFKGAENFSADDVLKSERFDKQGQRIQLAIHILADSIDDEPTFRAYARETVNRHRQFKMVPELWGAFFTVLVNFLETKRPLTDDEKAAWKQLGNIFDEECQSHLKNLGLAHV